MAKKKYKNLGWTEERRRTHGQKISAAAARKRAAKAAAARVEELEPPGFFSKIIKFVPGCWARLRVIRATGARLP